MLVKRVLAALVLAAVGVPAILLGGIPYFVIITLFLGLAAWEYTQIFRKVNCDIPAAFVVLGVVLLLVARAFFQDLVPATLTLLVLLAMTLHLFAYERGCEHAATDFAVTLGGIIYLGWIGAYLIDLRALPEGLWYFLLVLPSVWLADSAAYFVGNRFGRHRLAPRLSPKKTWEGYLGGIFFGTLGTAGLALLWHSLGGPGVAWWQGAWLGLVLSAITPLGDLGESMIKRQAGLKDSSNIIPGHGGFLDRVDSWLWAAALGYFLIIWFIQ